MATAQMKAIAILPKVGGALSIVGSCLMLRDIGRKWKTHPLALTTEVMALIAIETLLSSFWVCFLSTWMVPRGSPDAFLAAGNAVTCSVQGFIYVVTFIVLEGVYTILSVLYWLMVARGWTEQTMQRRRIRFLFLGLPVLIAVAFATPLWFLSMYNFGGAFSCFIEEYPLHCDLDPDVACKRGTGKADGLVVGLMGFVLACTVVILAALALLVKGVRDQEKKGDKYSVRGQEKRRDMTRKTLWQAMRYFAVFFITNLPLYIVVGYDWMRKDAPDWILYLYLILWPMFGVFNAWAYFYPKYASHKEKRPNESWARRLLAVLDIDAGSDEAAPPAVSDLIEDDPDLGGPLLCEENDWYFDSAVVPTNE